MATARADRPPARQEAVMMDRAKIETVAVVRKLSMRRQSLRELSSAELPHVAGGGADRLGVNGTYDSIVSRNCLR